AAEALWTILTSAEQDRDVDPADLDAALALVTTDDCQPMADAVAGVEAVVTAIRGLYSLASGEPGAPTLADLRNDLMVAVTEAGLPLSAENLGSPESFLAYAMRLKPRFQPGAPTKFALIKGMMGNPDLPTHMVLLRSKLRELSARRTAVGPVPDEPASKTPSTTTAAASGASA
ncbi:MAG: hypothetical protein AN485_24160, partial [Anabaena sp. MDT14b]